MSDLLIRPLEPGDARALHDLITRPEVARALGGTPFDSPFSFENAFRASFGAQGNERLGAFRGGVLAGFVELARSPRARLAHAAQLALAVRGEERGRGAGTALLQAMLAAADSWMHTVRIDVEVLAEDAVALRLLERHGFEVEVRRRSAILLDGGLADTVSLGRIRPGFVQAEGALRPMPAPPPRQRLSGPIEVRPARPDDAAAMTRFSRDPTVLAASTQSPTLSADYWRRRIEAGAAGSWSAVVLVGGELAASGNVYGYEQARRRHALLLGMSVLSPYQGMGIGDRLLAVLLDTASTWLGAERVELLVLADNARAVRLYEKHGFVHEGRVRFDVWRDGGYADGLVMARLYPRRGG